ncbi:MAG: DUF5020 family protein [Candidatus Neomarinimicrobiota bacterium]
MGLGSWLVLAPSTLLSQFNLQHHYDLGREIFTSTAEFLSHDAFGTTFGFTDINYDSHHYDKTGATDMYFEIMRYFEIPRINRNLSATVQYNDGVIFFPESDTTIFSAVNRVWLGGLSYLFPFEELSLSGDLLVRGEHGDEGLTYQITLVWFYPMAGRFAFMGFMDVWNSEKDATIVLMSEPQLAYQIGKFSTGMEVEVSWNFPAAWTRKKDYEKNKFFAIPTVFFKYTF